MRTPVPDYPFRPDSTTAPPSPEQIADALAARTDPPDSAFDHHLSARIRTLSSQHWTPLVVAAHAARWFDAYGVRTVVDVGSGAGKFCVATALAGGCRFTGLEHRASLVSAARQLARTFKVEDRVHFIQGALGSAHLPVADVYYFYNPFEENIRPAYERIDDSVELSLERHRRDLETVRELLVDARAGTYLLTYNGLGAKLPPSYQKVRTNRELPNVLSLWRKTDAATLKRPRSGEHCWSEGAA